MTFLRGFIAVLLLSIATASPVEHIVARDATAMSENQLFARGACTVPQGSGTCGSVSGKQCPGGTFYAGSPPNWPCPGNDDIQCCVKKSGGGQSCHVPQGSGTCGSVSGKQCPGGTFYAGSAPNWPCPGNDDIQCCVKGSVGGQSCHVPQGSGTCGSVSGGQCPGGTFYAGSAPNWPCPGNDDIQCCVKGGTSTDLGQRILNKAKEAAGIPYAWGGGSCSGPTHDNPPWKYGDIGFDCSGLVAWAVCQVTGRNLFSEGLRVTHSMYCASEAKLKYKKYPYAQRKLGDAVFFGGACSCSNPDTIHHVGLMMDSGDRMWNAPNDQINKVLEMSISRFGEKPCPSVIRFS